MWAKFLARVSNQMGDDLHVFLDFSDTGATFVKHFVRST